MDIHISRISRTELSAAQVDAWSALQRDHSCFASPFFRPEFSELVASVRPDIEVAVIERGGQPVGFVPYQRAGHSLARPVGLTLCDFQGAIVDPHVAWSPEMLIRQCGLKAWAFDHMIASQCEWRKFYWSYSDSPVMDLKDGFDEYCRPKRQNKSGTLAQTLRKMRKLEREVGPLRFVSDNPDDRLIDVIVEWKRAQYQRIRSADHLEQPWTRDVLRRMARFHGDDFSGMISALYAGEHLVAAHLGIRSRNVLHCWFPTYNREFQQYSPGIAFWIEMANHAAELGIQRIDLGKGDERYKQSLKTGDIVLAEGAIDLRYARSALRKGWWLARRRLRESRLAVPLRYVVGSLRALKRQETSELALS